MNKKMQCLKNLKSKLAQMQKELAKVDSNRSLSRGNSASTRQKLIFNNTTNLSGFSSVPVQSHNTKSPSWKNPNFWGTNPITGKENQVISPSKWTKKKSSLRQSERSPNLKLSEAQKFMSQNYYDNYKAMERSNKPKRSQKFNMSQRFQFSFHGNQDKDTPRFEKIKTYESNDRNPILDPEHQELKGKKILRKPSLSPNSNLIENPKSNPLAYYHNNRASILSPKSNNRRNLSPDIAIALSSVADQKKGSPHQRSCKKHFRKYFVDNFESKWNL